MVLSSVWHMRPGSGCGWPWQALHKEVNLALPRDPLGEWPGLGAEAEAQRGASSVGRALPWYASNPGSILGAPFFTPRLLVAQNMLQDKKLFLFLYCVYHV